METIATQIVLVPVEHQVVRTRKMRALVPQTAPRKRGTNQRLESEGGNILLPFKA